MTGPTGSAPPLLPGVMRLSVDFSIQSLTATNVLHFLLHETGGLGSTDVHNMVSDLGGYWINDIWKHVACNSATSTSISATYALIEGEPNVKKVHIADAVVGVAGASAEVGQVAMLILWDNGDPRRGGKPRNYLPFLSESVIASSSNIDTSVLSSVATDISTFLGHIQGHTVGQLVCDNLVEYSTINRGAYRAAGVTFNLLGGAASPYVATQRRRIDRLRG